MSSETKHSPEPWKAVKQEGVPSDQEESFAIVGGGEYSVDQYTVAIWLEEADARRIVACVNACEGISTQALEAGALRGALDHGRDILGHTDPECDEMNCDTKHGLMRALRALGLLP